MASSNSHPADTASLLLRLAIGPMLVAHGYNKVRGQGGLAGTARYFESLGLRPGARHARLGAATELGAGTLLTLGAANPLPAAGVVGLMVTAARTDHKGKGFLVFRGGWEYTGVVAAVAVALAGLGSGPFSIDRARGHDRVGVRWTLLAAALGLAGAAGILTQVKAETDDQPT